LLVLVVLSMQMVEIHLLIASHQLAVVMAAEALMDLLAMVVLVVVQRMMDALETILLELELLDKVLMVVVQGTTNLAVVVPDRLDNLA
jgi:hypothetical protein